MYDFIIIGGGPAALSAATYATSKQLNTVMVYEELGGKIGWLDSLIGPDQATGLPGNDLAHLLTTRALAHTGSTINDRVNSVTQQGRGFRVATEAHGALEGRTVLIATGATPLPLNVPGADRLADHGLAYSATTHAHRMAGKRVAVVGSNARALSGVAEVATTASRVFLIAADPNALATPLGQALRHCANVDIRAGYAAYEIIGDTSVEAVIVVRDDEPQRIDVDHVFVALGVVPNSRIVRDLVQLNAAGHIVVTPHHETSLPGLYAAGDVSSIFSEQVLIAIGDGARAARCAYDYLLAQALVPQAM